MIFRKTRFFIFFAALFGAFLCHAEGFIQVHNFTKENYSGGAQNWTAAQDSVGRMYIGNRDGMLIYDGARWKKAYLPNYTTVRSLYYDHLTDRMYAGGSEEFGYFASDATSREPSFHSLTDRFTEHPPRFSEIWKIFKSDESVWFQADNYLFCLTGDNVRSFPVDGRISTSALIGSVVYVALEDGKILTLRNGAFRQVQNTEPLLGKRIVSILPLGLNGELLICTSRNGLYRFTGTSVEPFEHETNDFLKANQLFCAATRGNIYVFGTVNSGAVIEDFVTGDIDYINRRMGLQNNTVLNISFDRTGNIWLCLDNGLDLAAYNSSVRNLVSRNNSIGAGYTSMIIGNDILYGTNQGLFTIKYPYATSPVPAQVSRQLQGQIWSASPTSYGLLIATDNGIYVYENGKYSAIDGIHGAYKVVELPSNQELAVASAYDAFHLLKHTPAGWKDLGVISGYDDIGGNFIIDNDGNIWIPHWRKGIYRLSLDENARKFQNLKLFDHHDGLPSDHNNTVANFYGEIIFATGRGFFKPIAPGSDKIIAVDALNDAFGQHRDGIIHNLPDGMIAMIDATGIYIASQHPNGSVSVRRVAAGGIIHDLIPGFTHLNYISPDELIISTQDGFSLINTNAFNDNHSQLRPVVSAVYANRDSAIYVAPFSPREHSAIKLPFELNSLKFEFAYPDFENSDGIEYSSYLENYETDWSPFSDESSREYTRLGEGNYTLHLQVRDVNSGEVRRAAFGVSIMPPWFRTTLAKSVYAALAILFIIFMYYYLRRWSLKARRQMELKKERELEDLRAEAERDALVKDFEISNLKTQRLEQDIEHKSRELSSTTMSLIRKNEILSDLASRIEYIKQLVSSDGTRSSITKQLSKIQSSINENIQHDNDWNSFNKNFDIVYGDFSKRLTEKHPTLSASEIRLCCYIRMGLASKDIAPLINISAKSVEMARYRLRKKINLPPNLSLSDYLLNL